MVQEPLARDVVVAVEANDLDLRDAVPVGHDDAHGDGPLHVGIRGVIGDKLESS